MELNQYLDLSDIDVVDVEPGAPQAVLTLESLDSTHGLDEMAASCAPTCSCCVACCCCCPG